MPLAPERTVLVPLAHDEPMLRFGLTRGLVRMAAALAFMTPEERRLVDDLHGLDGTPERDRRRRARPGAAGRRRPGPRRPRPAAGASRSTWGGSTRRRASTRWCGRTTRYRRAGGSLGLVLAGRPTVDMGLPDWVRHHRLRGRGHPAPTCSTPCEVVVLPSPHESLSLVALEAWSAGRPTLATARSDVLAGQTARSGGGLLYVDDLSYSRQLSRLAADPSPARRCSAGRGRRASRRSWTWDACARRWRALLARVRRPRAEPRG